MFKVGDRVRIEIACSGTKVGEIYTLEDNYGTLTAWTAKPHLGCTCQTNWKLISEGKMTLKDRIEAITGNTSIKEFGELLLELGKNDNNEKYFISLPTNLTSYFEIQDNMRKSINFGSAFHNPCDAIPLLKDQLRFLLDKSGKKDKEDKIEALKKQMDDIQRQIEELK